MWDYYYKPYVSVAQRQARARKHAEKMKKAGKPLSPVTLEGRTIARTFWGKAWCDNLEHYSDFENRLPRGRTYVRNGSVFHLEISPGRIKAQVSGSDIYTISINIKPLPAQRWAKIKSQCGGEIASLVDLLQGKLSDGVMKVISRPSEGLFPTPGEISMDCSCPDWADLCKHLAAVLYGVGARLDNQPELLFTLRKVDPTELIEQASAGVKMSDAAAAGRSTLGQDELSEVFGIELDDGAPAAVPPSPARVLVKRSRGPAARITTAAKPAPKAKKNKPPKARVITRSKTARGAKA